MMPKMMFGFNANFCVALICAIVTASAPAVAAGQETSNASLARRIEQLERANADLERRVRELEAAIKRDPASSRATATSGKWRDQANWRRLRTGMSMDDVRALLGEPERVNGGNVATWWWADGNVIFVLDKLQSWSEPRA